ncbi:hypothetical protein QYS48_02595 [Marivirga arenosa]|uniref:Uncharacterized protein n=1 Tax=Marivirga arenosa TaxID=3059076 RepID=A0AA49JI52_9BACT|nr:hypothetical protein [Marivirga sp. ABR2-2]WKK85957.2 hypothetical protein QYS48_02595 [Marivirga sp. ABR2-2]
MLAPASATFLWFQYEKILLRHEVKEKLIHSIDRSELVLIALSNDQAEEELDWEHSKEFEYQDEMYDVVEVEKTSDSVKYWVWWDHAETNLNKKLSKLVNEIFGNDQKKKDQESQLISFYKSLYYEQSLSIKFLKFFNLFKHQSGYDSRLLNVAKITETPPPKFLI